MKSTKTLLAVLLIAGLAGAAYMAVPWIKSEIRKDQITEAWSKHKQAEHQRAVKEAELARGFIRHQLPLLNQRDPDNQAIPQIDHFIKSYEREGVAHGYDSPQAIIPLFRARDAVFAASMALCDEAGEKVAE